MNKPNAIIFTERDLKQGSDPNPKPEDFPLSYEETRALSFIAYLHDGKITVLKSRETAIGVYQKEDDTTKQAIEVLLESIKNSVEKANKEAVGLNAMQHTQAALHAANAVETLMPFCREMKLNDD